MNYNFMAKYQGGFDSSHTGQTIRFNENFPQCDRGGLDEISLVHNGHAYLKEKRIWISIPFGETGCFVDKVEK